MFKNSNRGISTLIAIGIIAVLVVVVGGGILAYQYYYIPKQETPEIMDNQQGNDKKNNNQNSNTPVISIFSGPTTLTVGELGTWQIEIDYPTADGLANTSFYAIWGDESTPPPTTRTYVGPNNTSGADNVAKFSHTYTSVGTYHPIFIAVNKNNQQSQIAADVKVGYIYSNSYWGFSFEYPKGNTVRSQGYQASHPFTEEPVAYFQISNNNQTEGYLTVNVSDTPDDIANCTAPLSILPMDQKIYPTTMTINQVNFAEYNYGPGGVEGFTKDYKTVKNNLCFDIQITAFPSACVSLGCDNRLWSNQTETDLLNELDRYAKTFRFIR